MSPSNEVSESLLNYLKWQELHVNEVDIYNLYSKVKLIDLIMTDMMEKITYVGISENKMTKSNEVYIILILGSVICNYSYS
jgi:hypothetical protein